MLSGHLGQGKGCFLCYLLPLTLLRISPPYFAMSTALLFSGQGAQVVGMGKSLYEGSPTARDLYDRAAKVLPFDLRKACFEGPTELLTETRVCQPALYVQGYAIAQILRERGKLNDLKACLGLSLGELTAYAVAGVWDFETGLKIVAERGRLMQMACDQTKGAMARLSAVHAKTFLNFALLSASMPLISTVLAKSLSQANPKKSPKPSLGQRSSVRLN